MTSSPPVVLVIEDEPQVLRFLRASLGAHSYRIVEATTGAQGLAEAASHNPDVILLDLGLPDLDGLEVTRRLREWTRTPIIVISARGQDQDKVKALDEGADDYLTKPFSLDELLARIRVALRHAAQNASGQEDPVFSVGELRVDLTRREVFLGDEAVHLTPTEYKLLTMLIKHAGRVVTHRQLLKDVWGPTYVEQTHYLRVFVGQLRQKVEREPAKPRYIVNEPGIGYRLKVKGTDQA
jgi:two-component system KDP operon response regulator KdpE